MLKPLTDYLNPQWCVHAPTAIAKLVAAAIKLTHHECNNPVCKGVSFTYGTGFPALWSHANLNDETHAWISQEFAQVPITFFEQIVPMHSRQGHLAAGRWPPRTAGGFRGAASNDRQPVRLLRGTQQPLLPRRKPAADV